MKNLLVIGITMLCCVPLLAQRISIIGDEVKWQLNSDVLPELTAAALVEKYECDTVLRFESAAVVRERSLEKSESMKSLVIKAPAADQLVYVHGGLFGGYELKYAGVQKGMDQRAQLARFFRTKLKASKSQDYHGTSPAREMAQKLAKKFNLKPKTALSKEELEKSQQRKLRVAVMAPKIAYGNLLNEKSKTWLSQAQALQELLEAGIQEEFTNIKLLDRNNIQAVLREKQIAILGSPDDSISAMRLLGADYLVRPVVSRFMAKDGAGRSLKHEITLVVIRSSDGLVCSSVMHRGPHTLEALDEMIPLLTFPEKKKDETTVVSSGDDQLREWEAAFFKALAADLSYDKFFDNRIFRRAYSYKCLQSAYALSGEDQLARARILNSAGSCYYKKSAKWRRVVNRWDHEKKQEEDLKNKTAAELFPKLQAEARFFFDAISNSLDIEADPRMLIYQANWDYRKKEIPEAWSKLEQFRKIRQSEGDENPVKSDHFFWLVGSEVLAETDRYKDCREWINERNRFDTRQAFIIADCYAAEKNFPQEFRILHINRRQYNRLGETHFYGKRLIQLARITGQKDFLIRYIQKELGGWYVNDLDTQWELALLYEEEGEKRLAADIVECVKSRGIYDSEAEDSERWEKMAERLGVTDVAATRKFPCEINSIGKKRYIEFIPIGKSRNRIRYEEAAQKLATLLGCSVKLYPALPDVDEPGVFDMQENLYYAKDMLSASLLAKPPSENAIDRVLFAVNRKIALKNKTTGRKSYIVYSVPAYGGKMISSKSLAPLPNTFPNKRSAYVDGITLMSIELSVLSRYAWYNVESANPFKSFTRSLPDFTGRNGTYNVVDRMRASLGSVNSDIYQKINWDEYHSYYQEYTKKALVDLEDKSAEVKEATEFFARELKKAEPHVKMFEPEKLSKEVEYLRKF